MAKKLCPRCGVREKYRIEHGAHTGRLASYCRECDRERSRTRWHSLSAEEKREISEHRRKYNRKRYMELKPLAQTYRHGKTQEGKKVVDFLSACGKLIEQGFMRGLGRSDVQQDKFKPWQETNENE